MLLIFGFKIRTKLLGTVAFFCPRCGGDRTAKRLVARRWFTLFFIPVIPLKEVGEVVECSTCGTTFAPTVLQHATTASLHEMLANAGYALTLMVVRTADAPCPATRAAAVRDLQAHLGGYDEARLDRELAGVDPGLAEDYVRPLADGLEVAGKERLVADLYRTATADRPLNPAQRDLFERIGRGLGLTPAHLTGIEASASQLRAVDDD
ncbi:MAG: zinc ribbon domain-containing protein [Actinobacteria bacterium]|nr:zinc ribbon domain-containing protein [Actinomycetota bacterium]